MTITKSQLWARNLSKRLENSYEGSALVSHNVTSGSSRENQVLDILAIILPQKFPVVKNVVIVNSSDTETIKFDGAIVDIQNWARLFSQDELIVSPIESVKAVFEIKSNLRKTEIDKIFKEAKNINETSKLSIPQKPKTIAFAYKCANANLAYFDFVKNFINSPSDSPFVICILNIGILCFIGVNNEIINTPNSETKPIFIQAKEDSLLIFTYLITEFLVEDKIASALRQYSKHLYKDLSFFCFEDSFINKMKINSLNLRKYFKRNADKNIEEIYELAKREI
jgi:hypothetical protein